MCLVLAVAKPRFSKFTEKKKEEAKMIVTVPAHIEGILEDRFASFDDKDHFEWITGAQAFRLAYKTRMENKPVTGRFKIFEMYRITARKGNVEPVFFFVVCSFLFFFLFFFFSQVLRKPSELSLKT
jgi:hypothetical protein